MSVEFSEYVNCWVCNDTVRYLRDSNAVVNGTETQPRWLCPNCGTRVVGVKVRTHETPSSYNAGADKAPTLAHGWTLSAISLDKMAAPTLTQSGTGGTLTAATYAYKVTATTAAGQTNASNASTGIVVASGTTNTVTVNWVAVTGATGYKIYGRTGGTFGLIATVGLVTTYADTGSPAPGAAAPTVNSTVVDDGIYAKLVKA
jgi:hypothetical protein